MQRSTVTALATAGTLALGGLSYKLATASVPANLGPTLWASQYHRAIWIPTEDVNARRISPFDPSADLGEPYAPGWEARWAARYGVTLREMKGDTVGHAYAGGLVEGVLNHESNPLGVACNPRCVLTPQDIADVKLLTRDGTTSAYYGYFVPWDRKLYPPVQTLPPVPTPEPTATPPPVVPPDGGPVVALEPTPCPVGWQKCWAVLFSPTPLSTGAMRPEVTHDP